MNGEHNDLIFDLDVTPSIGYDLVHNRVPIIRHLYARPAGSAPLTDVVVTVTLVERDTRVASPWAREFQSIPAEGLEVRPEIVLDPAVMADIEEQRPATLLVEATSGDTVMGRTHTLRFAPESWIRWVAEGRAAIPRVRRRVLSSRVQSKREQLPDSDSHEERALLQVYKHLLERRHAFEMLASRVAAQVLGNSGASYHPGWLTRSGGDGGVDFVGRLDVGAAGANTPIVVLGQAKCVAPESSVSADQVARVVARLRRGWIGVFVTTGVFSERAQIEIIDDQYPLVLVPGAKLAKEVLRMAAADHDGDLQALLDSVTSEYEGAITHRRPEEILNDAAG